MKRHKRKQTLRCRGTQVLAKIDGGVHEKKQTFRFRHTRVYRELEEGTLFRLNKQSDEGQNNNGKQRHSHSIEHANCEKGTYESKFQVKAQGK